MKKRNLITSLIILSGSLFAAALMRIFTSNQSWVAFAGWVIFFIAIQSAWLLVPNKKLDDCIAWLSRLKKKSTN